VEATEDRMKPFNHIDARTIDEAAELLKSDKAKLIAGGTDLLGILKDQILPEYPDTIVNIKTISELGYIRETDGLLRIGALTKLTDISESQIIKESYKILGEAAKSVATPSIRRMATLGGNLCQDVRCWYYRYPHQTGGRIECYLKNGDGCYALTRENQYHSIFGGLRDKDTPCKAACPGSIDIASHMGLIRDGKIEEAAALLFEKNPLPAITGRVCPHFCEQECNRGDFDEPVSIRDIEKFLGDYILEHPGTFFRKPEHNSGRRIAIVGSGPAGLVAAYRLRLAGHHVTVFERMAEAGGTLNYVIPAYRLPKSVVQDCVRAIQSMGVEFKLNVNFGKDVKLSVLRKEYDAVFLATGALDPVSIGIPGEGLALPGVSFLISVKQGNPTDVGTRVAVIGGGNTAIDAARTAKRLGVKEVTIIYRRTRNEMPASPEEIDGALEEGVKIEYLTSPKKISGNAGKLQLQCTKMSLGEPDVSGRRQPMPLKGSEFTESYTAIISATGQQSELLNVKIDTQTTRTQRKGVFAGGDAATGPATVIEAIASGSQAARSIESYLGNAEAGNGGKDQSLLRFNNDYLKKTERISTSDMPVSKRSLDTEDRTYLVPGGVEHEANRCFNCGCVSVNASDLATVLSVMDAKVIIAGVGKAREVPVNEFLEAFRNNLEPGEIVTEIQVKRPLANSVQKYDKFRLRESIDFAVVSVASILTVERGICREARISLGAVAPRPIRAVKAEQLLIGHRLDEKQADAAAAAAVEDALPLEKNSYKVSIARELVQRAILTPEASAKRGNNAR